MSSTPIICSLLYTQYTIDLLLHFKYIPMFCFTQIVLNIPMARTVMKTVLGTVWRMMYVTMSMGSVHGSVTSAFKGIYVRHVSCLQMGIIDL